MATLEKLEGSKVKLAFEVSAEEFEKATQQAYIKTGKKYNVPGFRKGHAPRKMIENAYGPLVFFDDAFDIIYPDLYEAAVKEHGIEPVDRPDVSIEDFGLDKPLKFTAVVAVMPEVTLGAYKGIEVEKREYNVTDEMVEDAINTEREKVARFVDVERAVENGDTVKLDYSGSVDGVKFDGGTAEDQELVIGSGNFIPGFEEQMVGMKKGETRDLNVKFPEEYHAEELKGKDAVFNVTVKNIQVKELPAADDEFAKDISEFDTIEALRADKRRELTENMAKQAKTQKENDVVKVVVDNASVVIPDAMIDRQVNYMLQDIGYRLSMQGISLEDYFKYTGTDEASARAEMRPEAEVRVKSQLVLEAVSKAENVKAEEDDIKAKAAEYASQYGQDGEELFKNMTADDKAYFEDRVIWDKTIAIMTDSAVEVKAKKAAKKPAAKKADAKADTEAAAELAPEKKPAAKKPAAKKPAAKADIEATAEEKPAPEKKPAAKKPAVKADAEAATEKKPAAKKPAAKKSEKAE